MRVLAVITMIILSTLMIPVVEVHSEDDTCEECDRVIFFTAEKDVKVDGTTVIDSGVYREVHCKLSDAFRVGRGLKSIAGVSLVTTKTSEQILSMVFAQVVFRQNIDGTDIIYGYSSILPYTTTVNGKTVNIEIAVNGSGKVTAGCPIILGSY